MHSALSPRLLVVLCYAILLGAFAGIYGGYFPLPGGRMGHDFALTLTGLEDGYFWFRNNGFAIPWFSPSFCAGQPYYADPQSIYFSLPQGLTFLAGPVVASYWTLLACATAMFWGGYMLMRRVFASGYSAAVLVGGLLMFNGFLPHRLVVGHFGYHALAALPWLALLLLMPVRRRSDAMAAVIAAGGLLAYLVHGGFGTLILPGALSVAIVALAYGLRGGALKPFLVRGVLASLIAAGLAIGKLSAGFSLLAQYPRSDYLLPGAAPFDALIIALAGLALPSQWVYELGAPRLINVQWWPDVHEWAYGFTLAPLALLLVLAIRWWRGGWRFEEASRKWHLAALLAVCVVLPLAFSTWSPGWNAFLKSLPILGSASFPFRWLIAYLLPLAVLIGIALEREGWDDARTNAVAVAGCLLLTVVLTAMEPRQFYLKQGFDARPVMMVDSLVRSGQKNPAIEELGTEVEIRTSAGERIALHSNNTFLVGISQVFCYNPIFGYRLEKFSAEGLAGGDVLRARDGFLNLKNPACYVFPEENGCRPGDRFRADQVEQARRFVSYRPFEFAVSRRQEWANRISIASLWLVGLFLLGWVAARAVGQARRRGPGQ